MADTIWVYAEVNDDRITATSLEMLTKAAEVGKAEAILLGPAPDDAARDVIWLTYAENSPPERWQPAGGAHCGLAESRHPGRLRSCATMGIVVLAA